MHGRERRQFDKRLGAADVTGVQDQVGAVEHPGDRLGAALPMSRRVGVGQDGHPHASSMNPIRNSGRDPGESGYY
jgi:hypothetical protein